MKTRHGFVSNSSSSSFIVVLKPEQQYLAKKEYKVVEEEYDWGDNAVRSFFDESGNYVELPYKEYLKKCGYVFKEKRPSGHSLYIRVVDLADAHDTGLGRSTCMAYNHTLIRYLEVLEQETEFFYQDTVLLAKAIRDAVEKYGLENVLFLRESDEGMGGYLPPELKKLAKEAVFEMEWH